MVRRYKFIILVGSILVVFVIINHLFTQRQRENGTIKNPGPDNIQVDKKFFQSFDKSEENEAAKKPEEVLKKPEEVLAKKPEEALTKKPEEKLTKKPEQALTKKPDEKSVKTNPKYNGDVLIVGAGLSSAVMAHLHTTIFKKRVVIIEKRDHIGGNVYDFINELGIRVSKYGAHLFHTKFPEVWRYVSQFSEWLPYEHRVIGKIDNKLVPIPVNIDTVNILMNQSLHTVKDMDAWLDKNQVKNPNPKNGEEAAQARVGRILYEKIFKAYTLKQWSKDPRELDASVLQRIPVRNDWDDRYFPNDEFQALPKNGYTKFVTKMFQHPNITYFVKTDFFMLNKTGEINVKNYERVIFTGPIDQYFAHYNMDKLEYRSINFQTDHLRNVSFYQPKSVVNYPQGPVKFTRIVEYKHLYGQNSAGTTIVKEFSTDKGDPYYPVPNDRNKALYEQYKKLAVLEEKNHKVHFVGRLASYKYFNMDQAILNAINEFKRIYTNVSYNEELMYGGMSLDKAKSIFVKSPAKPSLSVIVTHCSEDVTWAIDTFTDRCDSLKLTFHIYEKCGKDIMRSGNFTQKFPKCHFRSIPVNVTQDVLVFLHHFLSKSFLFDDVNVFMRGSSRFGSTGGFRLTFPIITKALSAHKYDEFKKVPHKDLANHFQYFGKEYCLVQYNISSHQKEFICRLFESLKAPEKRCKNFVTSPSNFIVTEILLRRALSQHSTMLFNLYTSLNQQKTTTADGWIPYIWAALFRGDVLPC